MTIEQIFKTPIYLAPMAGVTDTAFRLIVRSLCAEKNMLMFSEMVSATGLHYRNAKTFEMLKTCDADSPVAIQLFGSEPNICAEAAKIVEDSGIVALDFNLGCPAPKIVKNGEGSALMKNPLLTAKILSEVRKAIKIPFSVKMRLGFDDDNLNAVEIAKIAESVGVDFITVHGRTRSQFYSGKANWSEIARVKAAVKIPVIANGDVTGFESFDKVLQVTSAAGVMIGRAAQGNPWLIANLINYFRTGKKNPPPSLPERIKIMRRHFNMLLELKSEDIAVREMRKHAAWYTKGLNCAAELRNKFNHAESTADFANILSELEVLN